MAGNLRLVRSCESTTTGVSRPTRRALWAQGTKPLSLICYWLVCSRFPSSRETGQRQGFMWGYGDPVCACIHQGLGSPRPCWQLHQDWASGVTLSKSRLLEALIAVLQAYCAKCWVR